MSLCKLVDAYLMSHRISGLPRDIVSHVAAKVSRGISCLVLCGVGGHDPALQIMAPKGVAVEPVLTSLRAFHGAHGNWPRRKDVRAGGDALARKAAAAAKAWAGMSPSEQEKLRRDFTAEIEWLVRKPPLGVGGQDPGPGLDAGGHDPALSASGSVRAVLSSLQVFYGEHGSWPSRRDQRTAWHGRRPVCRSFGRRSPRKIGVSFGQRLPMRLPGSCAKIARMLSLRR